jgi:hypothetical protein
MYDYSNILMFFFIFEPIVLDDKILTYDERNDKKWKAIFKVDFNDLKNLVESGVEDIDYIPFKVTISDIEYNFPIPELNNSTDEIKIPIDFDVNNLNKNQCIEIIFGEKNSIFTHLENIITDINKFI